MTDFDDVLETCLQDIARGASTLDECLIRHPEHADQLKPLLQTALDLSKGRSIRPSSAFKARTRAKLTLHMQANPRGHTKAGFVFRRLATGLAVITIALLATGTAYAQSALPGSLFYPWKLTSEQIWRAVSPDHVRTDIAIANRRIEEMNAVSDDPVRFAEALQGYQEVVTRLESELGTETLEQLLPAIEGYQEPGEGSQPLFPIQPQNTSLPPTGIPEHPPTSIPKIIPTIEIPSPIP